LKKDYTDITFIVDRSGSMQMLRHDVIGGFNKFIEDQRKVAGECTVTLVQFDNFYEVNYTAIPVNDVQPLNSETYAPRGTTAMYDAIGKSIMETGNRLAKMKEEDRPDKVIVIIQTDGEENASVEFSGETIKKMIKEQEEVYSWEFVFLGANINAKSTAMDIGIQVDKAMSFANSGAGMADALYSISKNVTNYRSGSVRSMAYDSSDYAAQSSKGVKQ